MRRRPAYRSPPRTKKQAGRSISGASHPPTGGSYPLDDDRRGHAAGRAHRYQPAPQIATLQLVEDGADQDRTGGADGMAECDRAAIDVDLVAVEFEVADEFFRDHGEGLVDLEQVDVIHGQTRP